MSRSLAMIALLLIVNMTHAQGTKTKRKKNPVRRTVLPESMTWDVETNKVARGPGGDLQWQRNAKGQLFLIASKGAALQQLSTKRFASTSLSHLLRVKYRSGRISAAGLKPGTVVAVRTTAGNFVKLRVAGYRENKDARHLQLDWVLYQAPYATTVLLGTFTWDLDTNKQGRVPGVDVFWQQVNARVVNLKPLNGTGLVKVNREFSNLSQADLAKLKYGNKPIDKKDLEPGAVVAIRTSDGRFGKLRVKRYRATRDFSFPSAKHLTEQWRALVMRIPNIDSYHIEFQWELFGRKKTTR